MRQLFFDGALAGVAVECSELGDGGDVHGDRL
jgi:hypothetical protein